MPTAVCAKCQGSGWVVRERDGLSGAERCDCVQAERAGNLLESAAIPPNYRNASIDNFLIPRDNPVSGTLMAEVVLKVRRFVREFPAPDKPGLLFIGSPGTGKTHLAVAALKELISKGFEGVFFDYQNLLERVRASFDASSGTSDREASRTALDTDILLLDDLGAHRVTEFTEDTVTAIITHRCNHRKALIATTNLRDPEVGDRRGSGLENDINSRYFLEERLGSRARSRLFEMCRVIRMPAIDDYRIRTRR
jgi:DNA replication protein DnaC